MVALVWLCTHRLTDWLLQLSLVVQRPICGASDDLREFPYTALTALVMAMNTLPVVAILYLNLSSGADYRSGYLY